MPRGPIKLRKFAVLATGASGQMESFHIEAHYAFDNSDEGRGLIFRRYEDDDPENRTTIVAQFAQGFWASFRELPE